MFEDNKIYAEITNTYINIFYELKKSLSSASKMIDNTDFYCEKILSERDLKIGQYLVKDRNKVSYTKFDIAKISEVFNDVDSVILKILVGDKGGKIELIREGDKQIFQYCSIQPHLQEMSERINSYYRLKEIFSNENIDSYLSGIKNQIININNKLYSDYNINYESMKREIFEIWGKHLNKICIDLNKRREISKTNDNSDNQKKSQSESESLIMSIIFWVISILILIIAIKIALLK